MHGLARLYGIDKDEGSKQFLDSIVQVGTASVVAHSAISAVKSIPGVNIAASVLNAIVAASIIAALGEGAVIAFEQVYSGKRSVNDVTWVQNLMQEQFGEGFLGKVSGVAQASAKAGDAKDMREMIVERSVNDVTWVQNLMQEQFGEGFLGKVSGVAQASAKAGDAKDMREMIVDLVKAAVMNRGE